MCKIIGVFSPAANDERNNCIVALFLVVIIYDNLSKISNAN